MRSDKKLIVKDDHLKDFLLEEFRQCYAHMRHYDNLRMALMRFVFSFYSVLFPVIYGIFRFYFYEKEQQISAFYLALFLLILFTIGFLMLMMLLQNRRYFVNVAKQVNSIRGLFLKDFKFKSYLPLDESEPLALNFKSVHIRSAGLVIFLNSIVAGLATVFCGAYLKWSENNLFIAFFIMFIVAFCIQILYTFIYLKEKDKGGQNG